MAALGWLLNLGFAGSGSTIVAPTQPGLEYTLPDSRVHYGLPTDRLHYTMPEDRIHYTLDKED